MKKDILKNWIRWCFLVKKNLYKIKIQSDVNLLLNRIEFNKAMCKYYLHVFFLYCLRRGSKRLKINRVDEWWVQQRQHHRAHQSARERMLSLALRGGWIPTLHLNFFWPFFWGLTWQNDESKAPGTPQSWYLWPGAFLSVICHTVL